MHLLRGAAFRLRHSYKIWTVLDPRNTWLVTGNLLTAWWRCGLWGPDCSSPLPFTSGCHTSWLTLLWYSLGGHPLFCVCFSLSLWHFHCLNCYITLVPSECHQNIQSWSFPYGLKDQWCSPNLWTQPHSLWVDTRVWIASWLLIAVQWKFSTDFSPPPRLCCSLRFQSSPLTPPVRVFPAMSPPSLLSPQDGSLSPNPLSLFFIIIFCPYSFQRDWFVFLGIWGHPPIFRNCFVKVASLADDFFLTLFIYFHRRIITLQCCSGFWHSLTWISYGCICVPFSKLPFHLSPHPIPQGHPSAQALSALSHASNLDCWFDSHMITYMFQCYSLKWVHPRLLPQSTKVCSLHLCLFCCLAYRVIVIIFLNSIYMC